MAISFQGLRRIVSIFEEDIYTMSLEEFLENPVPGYIFSPAIKNEANANDPSSVTLGRKFFELDAGGRAHVIAHERAHYHVDKVLESAGWDVLWRLVDLEAFGPKDDDTGELLQGINGQFTPMENLTEAFVIFEEDPDWLASNYPLAYEFVSRQVV